MDNLFYIAGGGDHAHLYVFTGDRVEVATSWKPLGGTRSTMLVRDDVAVVMQPNLDPYAIELATGQKKWDLHAWKNFGSGNSDMRWGVSLYSSGV